MDEKKRDKKNKEAIINLFSSDDKIVMKGLKSIRNNGDASTIRPLLDVYQSASSDAVKREISDIFCCLKTEVVVDEMVAALEVEKYSDLQTLLLSGLWHSGLFPNEHIDTLSKVAIKGDFMTAVESVTVIENMEPPFQYEALEEASLSIAEYLDEDPQEDKTELIRSLQEIVMNFQSTVDIG